MMYINVGLQQAVLFFYKYITQSRGSERMCLGIPMQVKSIDGYLARCEAKGIEREVNLFMLQDDTLREGDFVMVHVGYAIQKMSVEEAHSAWELYDEILALEGSN